MTTKNVNAIRPAESESDDAFQELMFRFTAANERLKLAAHAMARGEDYGPATFVVEEATEALVQIHVDFDTWSWDMKRRHAPEAKEVQS